MLGESHMPLWNMSAIVGWFGPFSTQSHCLYQWRFFGWITKMYTRMSCVKCWTLCPVFVCYYCLSIVFHPMHRLVKIVSIFPRCRIETETIYPAWNVQIAYTSNNTSLRVPDPYTMNATISMCLSLLYVYRTYITGPLLYITAVPGDICQ